MVSGLAVGLHYRGGTIGMYAYPHTPNKDPLERVTVLTGQGTVLTYPCGSCCAHKPCFCVCPCACHVICGLLDARRDARTEAAVMWP